MRWKGGGKNSEPDARIFGSDGKLIRSFNTGGAVEFMQVSNAGNIWIGHGDDELKAEKAGGLSSFSLDGQNQQYFQVDELEMPSKSAMSYWCCYALNVTGEQAWTQFYSDMLVSCHECDGSRKHWHCWNKGATALIGNVKMVALAGRYGLTKSEIRLYELKDPPISQFKGSTRFMIDGRESEDFSIEGKGDVFHVVSQYRWYRVSLDQLFSA